jgi:O-antigen ligase
MIAEKPSTGWATQGAIDELQLRMSQAGAGDIWIQTENDFLQVGIVHGLPGVASYLCLYIGIIWGFLRARQRWPDHALWVGLASAGAVLVVLMLEFGLSVVVLGRNAFRHTLIVWAMLALAYLIVLWQQRQAHQEPT